MTKKASTATKPPAKPTTTPEAKPEAQQSDHWIVTDEGRKRFWSSANGMGFTNEEVHAALGVESMFDFEGTCDEALAKLKEELAKLKQVTEGNEREDLLKQAQEYVASIGGFASAPFWASTRFSYKGYDVTASVQGGLPRELLNLYRSETLAALLDFLDILAERADCTPLVDTRFIPREAPKAPPRQQAQSSAVPPPPPPPPSSPMQSGTPAGPIAEAQAEAVGAEIRPGEQMEMIEFVMITAPKGKPVIEFWRPNRQYPELTYHGGIENFFEYVEGAEALLAAGYTLEHFVVGQQYTIPMFVYWEQSPKNVKWKDITRIQLRTKGQTDD